MIEANISVDPNKRRVVSQYPFIKDPYRLSDNPSQAIAMTRGLEVRVGKHYDFEA